MTNSDLLNTIDDLERCYDTPTRVSRQKVSDHLTLPMQQWLAASPFFILSTYSEEGLDCSPRGDPSGDAFRILDEKTLAIPDRRGNNRIDTLRNLILDPRVGLIFMVPGVEQALRIKGTATISVNKTLLSSFASEDEPAPATVVLIHLQTAYVQNARAINRAQLWDSESYRSPENLPRVADLIISNGADVAK